MAGKVTEEYTYNDDGKLAIKTLTGEVNQAYGYFYKDNAAKDLDYVALPNGIYSYPLRDVNGRNRGRELTNGNGNKFCGECITYRKVGDHATNMPGAVWFAKGTEIRESLKYKYDSCGNIAEISENGKLFARYSYDSLNRLVREDNKKLGKTWLFAYDGCGNIISKREFAFTLRPTASLEELESTDILYTYDGDRLLSYGDQRMTYDDYGNPLTYKGNELLWQYNKRLYKYGANQFLYDGNGRRIRKNNITYTYDNDGRLIKQSNGIEFFYDESGLAGLKYKNSEFIYRKDAQGNIIAMLDKSGAVVVEYSYDAWGNYRITGDETIGELNPFRYRGYYYDTETGLYYLQTRYYDPEVGRFISQDDVSYLDPEHINGLNLYAYCGNNPVMNVDPDGTLFFIFALLLLGAIVGAVVGGVVGSQNGHTGLELLGDIFLGAAIGFAIAGAAITIGSVVAGALGATTFLGTSIIKAFSLGAAAFDIFGAFVAPMFGQKVELIEPGNSAPQIPSLPPDITGSRNSLQPLNYKNSRFNYKTMRLNRFSNSSLAYLRTLSAYKHIFIKIRGYYD